MQGPAIGTNTTGQEAEGPHCTVSGGALMHCADHDHDRGCSVTRSSLGGWVVYALFNLRQARDEVGSEIELAANRKKYYDDETSRARASTRVLGIGVVLLVVIVIGLPLYWVLEPTRQAGAQEALGQSFVELGLAAVRPHRRGWLQLRRLPRRHERQRR